MEPTPTLASVAARAGVSRQTVSNALNNPELLRPDTLERVRAVIAEVGYTPNRAARQLRGGSSHLVGLRFEPAQEGTANALMDRFTHTLVDTMRSTGHHVLLFSGSPDDPLDGFDDVLRSTAVDAFVLTDTYYGAHQAAWLTDHEVPFVAFGRPWDDAAANHPWVDIAGRPGVGQGVHHLHAQGHARIAWLGWEAESRIGEDRRAGWQAAMDALGLDPVGLAARITDNVDAARMEAHRLIDAGATAFSCASDTIGIGVLHAISERDLRPGRDVGVVGFDDSAAAQVTGLSSVRQPLEEVAVQVVELLRAVLAGGSPAAPGLLEPTLVVRTSSPRPAVP